MRFLLIDRITEMKKEESARGVKNLAMSEDYFAHHFVFFPVMPGMLMAEAAIQLSSWLISYSTAFNAFGLLSKLHNAKFRRSAQPGDTLDIEVKWVGKENERVKFRGRISVREDLIATVGFETRIVQAGPYEGKKPLEKIYTFLTTDFAKE